MRPREQEPTLAFASAAAFEDWLERHHGACAAIWLKLAKKGAGVASVTYSEALDAALCFGWIDGQKAPLDERFWLQRFTPRGRRSRWSQNNRDRVDALEREGRMRAAGSAEVERARTDGRWEAAYAGPRAATVPDDLQAALDANPAGATSSRRLTPPTATRSSTASPRPAAPRPASSGSLASSRCSPPARRSIRSRVVARRPRLPYSPPKGGVAQSVRAPACHAGGRGFESRRSRSSNQQQSVRLVCVGARREARSGG